MHINWFPGHMAKARRMIEEYIKKVDVVIELLDARIPQSSRNPMIKELINNKPHIVVLNKVDLADGEETKKWVAFFQDEGVSVVTVDSTNGRGTKKLLQVVAEKSKPVLEKWMKKGIRSRSTRTIILGIPNVGKSTLINVLAGTNATATADKPGKTRGQQWVKIGKNMELLDTPGVLWPRLEDQRAAARLAITGAISDDVYDIDTVVDALLDELAIHEQNTFKERYNIMPEDLKSHASMIEAVGKKRGCLMKGGIVDQEKARRIILGDYRDMKLGLITFDSPYEEQHNGEPIHE